jgi:hypothetical protein
MQVGGCFMVSMRIPVIGYQHSQLQQQLPLAINTRTTDD